MTCLTISTQLCGISMTWAQREQEKDNVVVHKIGFDPVARVASLSITPSSGNSFTFWMPQYNSISRGYEISFNKKGESKKYIVTVNCPEISTTKVQRAFNQALSSGALTSFLGGASLALQFSTFSTKVKIGSCVGLALSLLPLFLSIHRFKTESLSFGTHLIAVRESAINASEANKNQVNLFIPDYLYNFRFMGWKV